MHVGELGVLVCVFNMLCAINVNGEPNRHWQSETESMGANSVSLIGRESRRPQKEGGRSVGSFFHLG